MKIFILRFCTFYYKRWFRFRLNRKCSFDGIFFKIKIKTDKHNIIKINNKETTKSNIQLEGVDNLIHSENAIISDSLIFISGNNNQLILKDNVILRKSNIIIRGNGCKIIIGKHTTFGGIRIVNVGSNNNIIIGDECLFSDNIELWASDTHSIMNEQNEWINYEKHVIIGNKVWIGSRVIILKGVEIGDGSVVGMGSLVTKNIPKKVISAGYPNKILKENITWKLDYPIKKC